MTPFGQIILPSSKPQCCSMPSYLPKRVIGWASKVISLSGIVNCLGISLRKFSSSNLPSLLRRYILIYTASLSAKLELTESASFGQTACVKIALLISHSELRSDLSWRSIVLLINYVSSILSLSQSKTVQETMKHGQANFLIMRSMRRTEPSVSFRQTYPFLITESPEQ